jgi:predicted RNase H-like nuclease (RuvC/YqgF family)
MDHREIAESIVKHNGCSNDKCQDFDCRDCQFDNRTCWDFINGQVNLAKQWLKDNPKEQPTTNDKTDYTKLAQEMIDIEKKIKELNKQIKELEQPMTNKQRIKELEKQLACTYENYIQYSAEIQAEIEELKKPKYEIDNNGVYSIGLEKYSRFETMSHRGYVSKGLQIFLALAKFAEKYDPDEKYKARDGENTHWSLFFNEEEKKYQIYSNTNWKQPTVIYFSTEELANAALQMLKDEKLIIV